MLFLSLLSLPVEHRKWSNFDQYHAHQLIWKAFPGRDSGDRPFLFSLDRHGTQHSLLVQSHVSPDWSFLNDASQISQKSIDPDRVPTTTALRFFLRANPTVDRKGYADGKTRRVGVGTNPEQVFKQRNSVKDTPVTPDEIARWREAELKSWLQRRGQQGGFDVDETSVQAGPIVSRRIVRTENGRPKGRPMVFHEVEFTGLLSITDLNSFKKTWLAGIGRGRAFGYGLLMIRPT